MRTALVRAGLLLASMGASGLLARWLGRAPWTIVPLAFLTALPGLTIAVRLGEPRPILLGPGLGFLLFAAFAAGAEWVGLPPVAALPFLAIAGAAAWASAPQRRTPTDPEPATGDPARPRSRRATVRGAWATAVPAALALALALGVALLARNAADPPRGVEVVFLQPAGRAIASVCGGSADAWLSRLPAVLAPVVLVSLFALGERLFASPLAGLLAMALGILHWGALQGSLAGIAGFADPCGFAAYVLAPLAILLVFPASEAARSRAALLMAALGQLLCLFALVRTQFLCAVPLAFGLVTAGFLGGSRPARRSAILGLVLLCAATFLAHALPSTQPEPHAIPAARPEPKLQTISPGMFYVDPYDAVSGLYVTEPEQGPAIGLASILLLPALVLRRRTHAGPAFLAGALYGPLVGILLQPSLAPMAHAMLTFARNCRFFEWAAAIAIASAAGGVFTIGRLAWERVQRGRARR